MGSFYGYDFIFNGQSSTNYGIKISYFDASGQTNSSAGNEIDILQTYIPRRSTPYVYGRIMNKPLEFEVGFTSQYPIDAYQRSIIESWLLGQNSYLPLQILQDDLELVTYNVFFHKADNVYVGNLQGGMVLYATCDAPFGWGVPKTFTRTFSGNNIIDYDFVIYNDSNYNGYIYPNISFTLNTVGNDFTITNYSDICSGSSGSSLCRVFSFTDLLPDETITINNDLRTVASSTGLYRLDNFNSGWLRLVKGANRMNVHSGIGTFTITWRPPRTVGG